MSHFVLYLGLSASLVQRCEQMCKHMFSHIAINIDQDQALLYGLIYAVDWTTIVPIVNDYIIISIRTTILLWLHIFLN